MSKRADVLRLPEGLDSEGAEYWRNVAPWLWKVGLLKDENARADIEWLVRCHSRFVVLTLRSNEQKQQLGPNADRLESVKVSSISLRLSHRYGLTPMGRKVMADRGWPGTPNPIPEEMLDEDEK
jgi:hypothetical protein